MMTRENAKVGVLKVRLFRPFPAAELVKALPATVRKIAVLDRTKEPLSLIHICGSPPEKRRAFTL